MEAPTEDELEVAGILQALPELIFCSDQQSARCPPRSLRWRDKKKRSVDRRRGPFLRSSPKSPSPLLPTPLLPQQPLSLSPQPRAAANHSPPPLSSDARKSKVETPVKAEARETSSPASPLCFYPSSEENDNNRAAAGSNLVTGTVKKTMAQNRKRIREQNGVLARLFEENQSLQQERSDFATQYQSLYAENSRLKELKSKREMEQSSSSSRIQQGQHSPSPSPVGPVDPDSAHRQQHQPGAYPKVPIEPPLFSAEQKPLLERRSTPSKDETLPSPTPLVSPRFWSLRGGYEYGAGGGAGMTTLIPDLNARLDDTEFGLANPEPELQKQQLVVVVKQPLRQTQTQLQQMRSVDAKRKATAEARKKRVEINRRKAAAAALFRNGRVASG